VLEHEKEAGTRHVTTHGLRGTWSSIKRASGMSAEQIAEEMGHADHGRTADRHYIDPQVAADAQGAVVADALYDGIPMPVDPERTPRLERPLDGDGDDA
jgi:integrase